MIAVVITVIVGEVIVVLVVIAVVVNVLRVGCFYGGCLCLWLLRLLWVWSEYYTLLSWNWRPWIPSCALASMLPICDR